MFENSAGDLEERVLQEGEVLLVQGEETPNVYILKEGALVVSIEGEEVCRVCTPESVFGEVSVLLGMEATGTVTALEPTTVWVVEDMLAFMQTHPTFAISVARELAARLYNMNLNLLEVRAELQDLEEQCSQLAESGVAPALSEIDKLKKRQDDASQGGIVDQADDMISVKRGKPIVITGIIKKMDKALNNPRF